MTLSENEVKATMRDLAANLGKIFRKVQPYLIRKDPGCIYAIRYGCAGNFHDEKFCIANPEETKKPRFRFNSLEKIERTVAHCHVASWQSADPANGRFAGGISTPMWMHGISGCDQFDDHNLCVVNAVWAGHIREELAYAVYTPPDQHPRLRFFFERARAS